jgi:hypothetical protein
LESIVHTAATIDHAGVKGESSRLLCYLVLVSIKYPKLSLIENLTKLNAFDIVVGQLKSEHAIMVNEALLSLNICANFSYSELSIQRSHGIVFFYVFQKMIYKDH